MHSVFCVLYVTSQPVTRLALSYDATLLLVGMGDGTVATWDVSCGQLLKTFRQHKGNMFIYTR